MNTERGSPKVRILSERRSEQEIPLEASSRLSPATAPNTPTATAAPLSTASDPEFHRQFLASMSAIAALLAVRFILLAGLLGAFLLGMLAVLEPSTNKLIAAGTYDVLVFIPLVVLYMRSE